MQLLMLIALNNGDLRPDEVLDIIWKVLNSPRTRCMFETSLKGDQHRFVHSVSLLFKNKDYFDRRFFNKEQKKRLDQIQKMFDSKDGAKDDKYVFAADASKADQFHQSSDAKI